MKGIRVYPSASGFLAPQDVAQPGAYGKMQSGIEEDFKALHWWQVTAPNGDQGCLNPEKHTVQEHSDGTITVNPSIVTPNWHGWLRRGVWESC